MNRQFETPEPIELYVEIGKGKVEIRATGTTTTTLDIEGRDADEVTVTFEGNRLSVIGPKDGGSWFSGRDRELDVTVELPTSSNVAVKTGSADIEIEGQVNEARLKTGSGDVTCDTFTGPGRCETGSGDVEVSEALAELQVKSGSGDISVGACLGNLNVSTGSGDVEVGTTNAKTVVKTGSGDLRVVTANADLSMSTGSGDLSVGTARRGRVSLKGASSDVEIGIPAGTPVWADINTVTGTIRSHIESVGAPQEGQEHVELQARTVSGDITLTEV
ncbi:MAG TPA: DUF4097 family beta strand repeat-containing protein [Nocardioides sp.]|uniref:DUF4097 family beta strand repeat-containing protein n=1 Tax=Nocardioides sp. TaxID=35761 RepID=UPI002F42D7E8